MLKKLTACLMVVFACACSSTLADANDRILIYAGTLLAVPGEAPKSQQTIVIEDGKIVAIRDTFTREPAGLTIDLSKHFVMPGVMDMHTHLMSELGPRSKLTRVTTSQSAATLNAAQFAKRTLDAGFTTVRNVGGDPEVMFALRDGIAAGKVPGPRIFAAGDALSGTGGHADTHGYIEEILKIFESSGTCDGADDCRRAVRAQVKRGSDWIKITATGGVLSETAAGTGQQLFDDELASIVATATSLGRHVAAHAHGTDGINAALRAGVRSIEHGTYLDEESVRLFKEKGAYLVPTMLAGTTVTEMAQGDNSFFPPSIREKAMRVGVAMHKMVTTAYEGGVKIAFGTDSGVSRHGTNAREFELLVDAGMSEMDALKSATVVTAELLEISDRVGTLEPGKWADIIALPSSPLEDISVMKKVDFVMKEGTVYKEPAN